MANVVANVLVGVATVKMGTAGDAAGAATTLGYTEDGVTIEYTADTADIEVEEETFPIGRVITKETVNITLNCAESLLANLGYAMGGADGLVSPIVLGGGVLQAFSLKIDGIPPLATSRTIEIKWVHATGTVGMAYKKGEKTVIPITFSAYKGLETDDVVTITDV